jgi:hypothetical protein
MVAAVESGKTVTVEMEPLGEGKWQWRVVEKVGLLEREIASAVAAGKKMAARVAGLMVEAVLLGEK